MVSLPDEAKIKAEINRLIESDNEDDEIVERIEGAHIVRLNAEKDDNQQLKKQVTSLQTNLRRATLRGNVNPADFAEQLIAAMDDKEFRPLITLALPSMLIREL